MDIKSIENLDPEMKTLAELSQTARTKAHSTYSNFKVGAALLCKNGKIYSGCNVENITLGLTICAERTAIVKAVSEGDTEFVAVAVAGVNKNESNLVSPCGACRQFLAEFNPRIKVYMYNPNTGKVGETSLEYLLPESFSPETVTL